MATQTIGKVRVVTSSQPITNTAVNAVKIAVNSGNPQKVSTVNYLSAPSDFYISGAGDVQFDNTENNLSVLTYDSTLQKFVVQNVPRLNGGTF